MIHVAFDEAQRFAPAGHDGVTNRLLVGDDAHGVGAVGVWYGEFEPGGHAAAHRHDSSTQAYVVLTGSFTVEGDGASHELGVHDTVIIAPGEEHSLRAGDQGGTVMVISSPALR